MLSKSTIFTQEEQVTTPLKYRADIDGLRAIAVALVLVFHFSLIPIIKAGFLGVDIFFVISGFLITTIIKGRLEAGTFSLWTFYANRIRRLAPALLTVLLLVMSAGVLWIFPNELIELAKQAFFSQIYVANIYYWKSINYFGLSAKDVFLLHTWSLAVEEQFYLIYPICISLLYKYMRKVFWVGIAVGLILSFSMNILFVAQKPEAAFYLFPSRAWELLIGALVVLVAQRWTRSARIDNLISVLGAGLLAIGVLCYSPEFHFPGYFALFPTIGSACLLLSGQAETTRIYQVLRLAPIVYIGKISYSLYLVHWPVNIFARLLFQTYSSEWRLAMLALSFALAALIYHTVEDPIRRGLYLATPSRLLVGYTSGVAITLSVFAIILVTGGLPQRFPAEVVRLANYVNDRTEALAECKFSRAEQLENQADSCHIGATARYPTWLVYGDSHAWAAHAVFDRWLKLKGQAGILFFLEGCPPLNEVHIFRDKGDCFAFNQAIMKFIESHANLSNIVLVSIWSQASEGLLSNSPEIFPTKEYSLRLFSEKFSSTVEYLHHLGRQVYVWEPVPRARKNVPVELARAEWEGKAVDLEIELTEYIRDNQFFFDALNKNYRWISASFSSSKILCLTNKCSVEHDGVPLYFDDNHMTKSTADFWITALQRSAPIP